MAACRWRAGPADMAAGLVVARRGTPIQRVRASFVAGLSWLACRLPERPLVALAGFVGEAWYRLAPARAGRAKSNLARVCQWLAQNGGGPPPARAAATERRALGRRVRLAIRHAPRYTLVL